MVLTDFSVSALWLKQLCTFLCVLITTIGVVQSLIHQHPATMKSKFTVLTSRNPTKMKISTKPFESRFFDRSSLSSFRPFYSLSLRNMAKRNEVDFDEQDEKDLQSAIKAMGEETYR
jgi:hypothetical protein